MHSIITCRNLQTSSVETGRPAGTADAVEATSSTTASGVYYTPIEAAVPVLHPEVEPPVAAAPKPTSGVPLPTRSIIKKPTGGGNNQTIASVTFAVEKTKLPKKGAVKNVAKAAAAAMTTATAVTHPRPLVNATKPSSSPKAAESPPAADAKRARRDDDDKDVETFDASAASARPSRRRERRAKSNIPRPKSPEKSPTVDPAPPALRGVLRSRTLSGTPKRRHVVIGDDDDLSSDDHPVFSLNGSSTSSRLSDFSWPSSAALSDVREKSRTKSFLLRPVVAAGPQKRTPFPSWMVGTSFIRAPGGGGGSQKTPTTTTMKTTLPDAPLQPTVVVTPTTVPFLRPSLEVVETKKKKWAIGRRAARRNASKAAEAKAAVTSVSNDAATASRSGLPRLQLRNFLVVEHSDDDGGGTEDADDRDEEEDISGDSANSSARSDHRAIHVDAAAATTSLRS